MASCMSSLVVLSNGLWLMPAFWPRTNNMACGITSCSFIASWPAPLGRWNTGTPKLCTACSHSACSLGLLGAALVADARMGLTQLTESLQDWQAAPDWTRQAKALAAQWNVRVTELTQDVPQDTLPYDAEVIGAVRDSLNDAGGDSGKHDVVVCAAGTLPAGLTLSSAGTFTYTPNANFNGTAPDFTDVVNAHGLVRGDGIVERDEIRIDIDADQLARHPAALTLQGDAGATMAALLPHLTQKPAHSTQAAHDTRTAARAALADLSATMPAQLEMVEAIRSAQPQALIVGDSTQPIYAANLFYDHDRPGGYFNAATGFGALGFGPGAAVGAAIAAKGAKVVCLIGDGGLQFSPGELRTAVDENLPVTFLVWNNAAFNEIADAMRGANTEVIGCSPSPLNMEPFAAACDLPFTSVPMEPEALHWALSQPCTGPRMIEVRVPR
mgnify:CR=1 FL=1